ncbi:MAG: ribose-phosphate diphosphokinase [Thermoplasmata archaeon]|nr:ribose-phosphate diphosphokinase [Thermoplasmata archaeon]
MTIVAGPRSVEMAAEIAEASGAELLIPEHRRFPDGEIYLRLDESLSGAVLLVQNAYPDEGVVELLLLVDLVRDLGAGRVDLLVPYMGYARQDRRFRSGEAVSAATVMRQISSGVDSLTFVDIHAPSVLERSLAPARNVYPARSMAEFLDGVDAVLAPDKGAVHRASAVARLLGVPWDHLEKTRLDAENVVIRTKELDVSGKAVAIVDDIISTGGTIVRACEQLRAQGATRVVAACTHGLFTGNALERLAPLDWVHSTRTLVTEASSIPLGAELASILPGEQ